MKKLSPVGMIGNNYIDVDAELGRLPAGMRDRRAWEVKASTAAATAKNLTDWLQANGIKATVRLHMPKGADYFKLGVELNE